MKIKAIRVPNKQAVLESVRAQRRLTKYMTEHNLTSVKANWNHPVHGPVLKEFSRIINYGLNKLNELNLEIMKAKKEKKAKEKELKNKKEEAITGKKLKKPVVKVEASKNRVFTSYDYPTIDGKELSPELKKKYRAKIRSLVKSQMSKEEATKKAIQFISGLDNSGKTDKKEPPKKEKAKKEVPQKEEKKVKSKKDKTEKEKKAKKDKKPKKVED